MIAWPRTVSIGILRTPWVLAVTLAAAAAGATSIGDQSGVRISGSSDFVYTPCATLACDVTPGNWSRYSQGGPGSNLEIGDASGGVTPGNADGSSRAILVGSSAVPLLNAYAAAFTEPGTYPGYSSSCCYVNSAYGSAQAVQYYTYIGTEPMEYQVFFSLHGSASGAFSTISGGLSLWDGIDANIEAPYGHFLDGADASVSSSALDASDFLRGALVSATLNPGDGFYLFAYVNATVPSLSEGIADASNTFTTGFAAGDPSLLVPFLPAAPIPEPGTFGLLASGLGTLAAARRRAPRKT